MDTDSRVRNTAPCPICGKCDYEWGFAKDRYCLSFAKAKFHWLYAGLIPSENLTARSCRECGHVALFRPNSMS